MPPKARKGPEAHASATPVGTVAKGNDGNMWVVTETANGVNNFLEKKLVKNPWLQRGGYGGRFAPHQDVASFKPPERIESYHSPVHGSDVPYPYAVGAKASYLLL